MGVSLICSELAIGSISSSSSALGWVRLVVWWVGLMKIDPLTHSDILYRVGQTKTGTLCFVRRSFVTS